MPDPSRFPAPKSHIHRMPAAQICGNIPPWCTDPVEQRLKKISITEFSWGSCPRMFGLNKRFFQYLPHFISDPSSGFRFCHPKFEAFLLSFVQSLIREHCLRRQQVFGAAVVAGSDLLSGKIQAPEAEEEPPRGAAVDIHCDPDLVPSGGEGCRFAG